MFMLIAGGRGKEKRGKKRALLDCPFPLLCFLHRLCGSYLLKIKCVLKFRTLFISSKTCFSFQRKDKHEKFGVVSVLQGLETACSLEISVPQEQTFNCSENSQASESFTGMHDAMIENFRLISGLQKQLEKHMSNCSWRVVAKFEADAMEFRLFWMFLRKKNILEPCICSDLSYIQGCKGQRGTQDHVNKHPMCPRLDITHVKGTGKLPLVSLGLCWALSTHLSCTPLDTVI